MRLVEVIDQDIELLRPSKDRYEVDLRSYSSLLVILNLKLVTGIKIETIQD